MQTVLVENRSVAFVAGLFRSLWVDISMTFNEAVQNKKPKQMRKCLGSTSINMSLKLFWRKACHDIEAKLFTNFC